MSSRSNGNIGSVSAGDLPLVSLCIATMNRSEAIDETLATIASEVDDRAEIVIVDGSGDGKTEQVVDRWRPKLPRVRYKQCPPSGLDRDYATAVALGSGRYRWPFTDDDWMLPGTYDRVIAGLAQRPAGVIVNFEFRDHQMRERLCSRSNAPDSDQWFEPSEFDQFVGYGLSAYIGSLVIDYDWWQAREPGTFDQTDVAHVWRLFQSPPPGRMLVLAKPGIAVRVGVSSWSPQAYRIWIEDWPRLIWSLPEVSDAMKARITPREPWRSIARLLRLRAVGGFSREDYERWLRPKGPGWRIDLVSRMMIRMPARWLASLLYYYLRLFRPSQKVYLAELAGARFVLH